MLDTPLRRFKAPPHGIYLFTASLTTVRIAIRIVFQLSTTLEELCYYRVWTAAHDGHVPEGRTTQQRNSVGDLDRQLAKTIKQLSARVLLQTAVCLEKARSSTDADAKTSRVAAGQPKLYS